MNTANYIERNRVGISVLLWCFAIVFFLWYASLSVIGGCGWVTAITRHDDVVKRRYLSLPIHPDFLGLQGTTVLYWAAREGDAETVHVLLARGANPAKGMCGLVPLSGTHPERYERTWKEFAPYIRRGLKEPVDREDVLRCALTLHQWEAAEEALRSGANVNERQEWNGYTLLLDAVSENKPGVVPTVKFLLDHGASVNARGRSGVTALTLAAQTKDAALIALLKQHGATR